MTTTVSPSTGSKHERAEDEEETRRVSQRVDENETTAEGEHENVCPLTSIKECIKGISRSHDSTDFIRENLMILSGCLGKEVKHSYRTKHEVFLNVGGPLIVVNVLRKYLQDRTIQEHGMMILAKMTPFGDERVSTAVADVDGISVVLETISKYYATKRIQMDGLITLYNVGYGQEAVKMIVREADGIPVIIESMDMHLTDDEVVEKAVKLLNRLVSNRSSKDIRKAMVKAKAASALSRAIEEHEDNENIQKVARQAMKSLML